MQEGLLQQGLDLMLFGMGTVFVFLTLLVFVTSIMSNVVSKYLAEEEKDQPPVPQPKTNAGAATVDNRTLAIIQAAVHAHRAKHQL